MKQCEVLGCQKETGAFFAFCKDHWKLVPLQIKDELSAKYITRQKDPKAYQIAMNKALLVITCTPWLE